MYELAKRALREDWYITVENDLGLVEVACDMDEADIDVFLRDGQRYTGTYESPEKLVEGMRRALKLILPTFGLSDLCAAQRELLEAQA